MPTMDRQTKAVVLLIIQALSILLPYMGHRPALLWAVHNVVQEGGHEGEGMAEDGFLELVEADLMHLLLPRVQYNYGVHAAWEDIYVFLSPHPTLFKAITGFFPAGFRILFEMVQPFIDVPVNVRGNRRAPHLEGAPRSMSLAGLPIGRPSKLTLQSRFLIFLMGMRGYNMADIVFISGLNQASISDDFWHMISALIVGLDHLIKWPTEAERAALEGKMPGFGGLSASPIGIWDGTIQEVCIPSPIMFSTMWGLLYCKRKKRHGYNHLLCCDWSGRIIACNAGFYGYVHDAAAYQMTDKFTQPTNFYSNRQTALGDSGFTGCDMLYVMKAPRGGQLTDAQKIVNSHIRRHRVLIEFVIGGVKRKFPLVERPFVKHPNTHRAPDVFVVACQLINFWQQQYGYLRGAAYLRENEFELWERKLLQIAGAPNFDDLEEAEVEVLIEGHMNALLAALAGRP